jgi:hypothetical protein
VTDRWGYYVLGAGPLPKLPVDVVVREGSRDGRSGKVHVHFTGLLEPRDLTVRHGIPVVTAARALLKADGEVANVLTEPQLRDVVNRAGRRRGANKILRLIDETKGLTRSEAERILRRLLKAAGLPQPSTNYPIGRYEADFAWPAVTLISGAIAKQRLGSRLWMPAWRRWSRRSTRRA